MRDARIAEREAPPAADACPPEDRPAGVPTNDGQLTGPPALMLAILEDAIQCAHLPADDPRPGRRRLRSRARFWIQRSEPDWLFSFESICDALSIDASRLRRRIASAGPVDRAANPRRLHGLPRRPRKLATSHGRPDTP